METTVIIILAAIGIAELVCALRLMRMRNKIKAKRDCDEINRLYYELQGSGHCDTCPYTEDSCKKIYTAENTTICVL